MLKYIQVFGLVVFFVTDRALAEQRVSDRPRGFDAELYSKMFGSGSLPQASFNTRDVTWPDRALPSQSRLSSTNPVQLSADDCREIREKQPSVDVLLLGLLGRDVPCLGASRRCEHLNGPSCFPPHSQALAAWRHDRDLDNCGANWNDLANQCVLDAHRRLANDSPDDLLIRSTFNYLGRENPHPPFGGPAVRKNWFKSGLPLYPTSPLKE